MINNNNAVVVAATTIVIKLGAPARRRGGGEGRAQQAHVACRGVAWRFRCVLIVIRHSKYYQQFPLFVIF